MDWDAAIARHSAALFRIVASLAAMAGTGSAVLPRRLHRAVLRLLRPAEAAARRLVIIVARGLPPQSLEPLRPRPSRPHTIIARPTPPRLSLPLFDPPRRARRRRNAARASACPVSPRRFRLRSASRPCRGICSTRAALPCA